MMTKIAAGVALIAGWAAWGQTTATLSFEVASVKPSVPGPWRESKVGVDRIDFPNATLKYCVAFAYGVKEFQISGPSWLGDVRHDILAKGSEGTRRDQLPEMMQALLAERFKLQIHRETKEFNVIVLSVGKNGPKLKESPQDPGSAHDGARIGMSSSPSGAGRIEVKEGNMTALANTLSRLLSHPVVDTTGLTGRYDFDLEFSREDSSGTMLIPPTSGGAPPTAMEPGSSVFSSILQLGLRLDARKHPMVAIVVDHAEKTATGN
jgi:uncharacterized protein (TIGR03435 family)